jgi:hypothetical protein
LSRLLVLKVLSNRPEAELARQVLEKNGITVTIRSDDTGGLHPSLTAVAGACLLVSEDELEKAQELLQAYGMA